MVTVRSRVFEVTLMLAAIAAPSMLPASAHAYTQEQQQACTGDAFRLCSSAMPSIDRVTACLVSQRAALSPACRVFVRSSEPERSPLVTRASARKHIRPELQREAREGQAIR